MENVLFNQASEKLKDTIRHAKSLLRNNIRFSELLEELDQYEKFAELLDYCQLYITKIELNKKLQEDFDVLHDLETYTETIEEIMEVFSEY